MNADQLAAVTKRSPCPSCDRSYLLYCAFCAKTHLSLPRIRLPVQLHILRHIAEYPKKSTAVHAKLIAPQDVHINVVDVKNLAETPVPLFNPKTTVLLYPHTLAKRPSQLLNFSEIDTIVILDGTWSQSRQMLKGMPEIAALPKVTISPDIHTLFWRYQYKQTEKDLATIEAMYHVMREWERARGKTDSQLDYLDAMVLLFHVQYCRIQHDYAVSGKKFTRRHRPGYIKPLEMNNQENSIV